MDRVRFVHKNGRQCTIDLDSLVETSYDGKIFTWKVVGEKNLCSVENDNELAARLHRAMVLKSRILKDVQH